MGRHGFLGEGGWFALPWRALDEGGTDDPENGEALCWVCYERLMQEIVVQPGSCTKP